MGDLLGPGFFNKPRYRHEVLIGNWYEDRALRDPSFLPVTTTSRKVATVDTVVKDEVRPTSTADLTVNGGQNGDVLDRSAGSTGDFSVNAGDPTRGYYATTYKRSYGPRNGYIHCDSFLSSAGDFATRREAAMHPENMEVTSGETTINNNNNNSNNCLRCEQLAKTSQENSGCLRCMQLSGL